MNILVSLDPDTKQCTLKMTGRFTFDRYKAFSTAHQNMSSTTCASCLVDMTELDYMDSAALGMLLRLKEKTGISQITLRTKRNPVYEVLRVSKFDQLFVLDVV